MKAEALQQLAAGVGLAHEGLKREKLADKLSAWASKACLSHLEAQLQEKQAPRETPSLTARAFPV
jgi:hypothetical protein